MNKICNQLLKLHLNNYYKPHASQFARNLCYKSDISLDKLYPNSKQQIYTPSPPTVSTIAML